MSNIIFLVTCGAEKLQKKNALFLETPCSTSLGHTGFSERVNLWVIPRCSISFQLSMDQAKVFMIHQPIFG